MPDDPVNMHMACGLQGIAGRVLFIAAGRRGALTLIWDGLLYEFARHLIVARSLMDGCADYAQQLDGI